GAGIGDEIARRKPQFTHAAVDLLGEVADALQSLQLREGRIDAADRDHARHAGRRDQRQQQQKTAKGQLSDRERARSKTLLDRGKDVGHAALRPDIKAFFYTINHPCGGAGWAPLVKFWQISPAPPRSVP